MESKKTTKKPAAFSNDICNYVPLKGTNKTCEEAPLPYGYCKRHSKTVQAVAAKERYEAETASANSKKKYVKNEDRIPEKSVGKVPAKTVKRIAKNEQGRYEDSDTNIVFDPIDKTAYGYQRPDGGVSSLTKKHINICIANRWKYINPMDSDEEDSDSSDDNNTDEEDSDSNSDEEESDSEDSDSDDEDEEDSDSEDEESDNNDEDSD